MNVLLDTFVLKGVLARRRVLLGRISHLWGSPIALNAHLGTFVLLSPPHLVKLRVPLATTVRVERRVHTRLPARLGHTIRVWDSRVWKIV